MERLKVRQQCCSANGIEQFCRNCSARRVPPAANEEDQHVNKKPNNSRNVALAPCLA